MPHIVPSNAWHRQRQPIRQISDTNGLLLYRYSKGAENPHSLSLTEIIIIFESSSQACNLAMYLSTRILDGQFFQ